MIFLDFLGFFGNFGRRNFPPDLRSSDLPSKRLLGKGLASIGYETEWKGVRYARKDFVAVPSDIFRQEAGLLLKLPDHENVVKTHGLTVDKLSCSLVLDYMDDKLTDLLRKRKDLHMRSPAGEHDPTVEELLGIILQIARAVEHLHKHGILHGDLKSRNILVNYMNDGDKSLLVKSVKVADFGLVQTKRKSMPYVSHRARKLDMVRWKAPEHLMELFREATSPDPDSDSDEDFTGSACATHSNDAFCFGLTCFQILTGEEPYPKRNWKELVVDIVSNKRGLKFPSNLVCPQLKGLRELVDECCDADPDKRPTFVDIREKLEHMQSLQPWIVKEERKQLEEDFNDLELKDESDGLNSQFYTQGVISEIEKVAMLTTDAGTDIRELNEGLHDMAYGDGYKESTAITLLPKDVRRAKMMISTKAYSTSTLDKIDLASVEALPGYLRIDLASVEIKDPVRMRKRLSNRDDEKTNGSALVTFGTYLGCDYALKVFSYRDATWNRSELLEEAASLMKLNHPNVVQLMGFAQDEEKSIIVMELMDTDLRNFMKQRSRDGKRPFARFQEIDIISQIAQAMNYVHQQEVVHGDLNGSNILVKEFDECILVKVTDFGLSRRLEVWDSMKFIGRRRGRRPLWIAPEMESSSEAVEPTFPQSKKVDVFSFGMLCYEVLTGFHPFQDLRSNELARRMANRDAMQELPVDLDYNLKSIIGRCWAPVPDRRPTFEEICHELNLIKAKVVLPRYSGVVTTLPRIFASSLRPGGRAEIRSWRLSVEPFSGASPQSVRTDPGNLKKGSSREHTDLESTQEEAEGEGEDDSDEECEGDLDSAKVNASLVTTSPGFVLINPTELKLERVIGKGSFATVYVGTWLGSKFAVKRLKDIQPKKVEKELKFLCELRHPCIVQLIGASVRSDRGCSIVMELMGGDLRKLINSRIQRRPLAEPAFSMQTVERAVFRDFWQTRATAYQPHKRNRSHNQTKTSSSCKRCRTSKRASKEIKPDLQPLSDSRKRNRMLDQVLESAEKLQQHMDSRKPKKMIRSTAPHSDVVPFDLHEAVYIITRIALGMAFLHFRGVVHRDLKALNVLVPEHPGSIDVKITDFGVAEVFTSSKNLSLGVGTGFWVAPEMFRHRLSGEDQGMCRFDLKAADVYSFAMTCYEVLTGKMPMEDEIGNFSGPAELKLAVVAGLRPKLPADLNPDLDQLIQNCWDGNPEKRPAFSTICTRLQKIQQELQESACNLIG